ncbi:hypothetical protein RRG08_051422 [Elysia crispata]|uniref:Uncharacterized protein n=1 Tax=Elysia crispata TaxID=231223 RepID=A0AAE1B3Z1_9GAST|nr:hypothetical protein RRG08_051422 [Elysia crispata]
MHMVSIDQPLDPAQPSQLQGFALVTSLNRFSHHTCMFSKAASKAFYAAESKRKQPSRYYISLRGDTSHRFYEYLSNNRAECQQLSAAQMEIRHTGEQSREDFAFQTATFKVSSSMRWSHGKPSALSTSPFTSLPCSLPAMTRSLPQAANSRVQGSALVSVCQTKPQPNGRLCRLPLRAISNLFCVILFASSVPLCDQLSYCNSQWVQYWSLCHILFEQTTFPHRLILMVYKR